MMRIVFILLTTIIICTNAFAIQYETSESIESLSAVNDHGIIVGSFNNDLIIIQQDTIQTISNVGQLFTINNSGQIVGRHQQQPVIYVPNLGTQFVSSLQGEKGLFSKINDLGIAVGYVGSQPEHAFSIDTTQISSPSYYYHARSGKSFAYSINNNNIIVGQTELEDQNGEPIPNQQKAFAWQNGLLNILGSGDAENSIAYDINDNDIVVGTIIHPRSGGTYTQAMMVDLKQGLQIIPIIPQQGFLSSRAMAINNHDQIVGSNNFSAMLRQADGEILDLNDKVAFSGRLSEAHAINNQNMMLADNRILRPRSYGLLKHLSLLRSISVESANGEDRSVAMKDNLLVYLKERHDLFGPQVEVRRLTKYDASLEAVLPVQLEELAEFSSFGNSIAVYGNTIAIGAPEESNGGAVYIYEFNGTAWSLIQRIAPNELQAGDGFGTDIGIDQASLVISASNKGPVLNAGAVYTYSKPTNYQWQPDGPPLTVSTPQQNDFFGLDLSLDGNQLIIASDRDPNMAIIYTKLGSLWQNPIALHVPLIPSRITQVALSNDLALAKFDYGGNNLFAFEKATQWQSQAIGFVNDNGHGIHLENNFLLAGGAYRKSNDIWYQFARNQNSVPIVKRSVISGNEIIQSYQQANRFSLTRYQLIDIPNPQLDTDLQVIHHIPQTAEMAQRIDYQVELKNLDSVGSERIVLQHDFSNMIHQVLPDECRRTASSSILCVVDNIPGDSSRFLDFQYTPDTGLSSQISSELRGVRDEPDYANNVAINNVQNYVGTPGFLITTPLNDGTVVIPDANENVSVTVQFSSTFSIGSLSYIKVYLNNEFLFDSTLSNRVLLGNLSAGDYQLRLELFDQASNEAILVDNIPLVAEVRFTVTKPFLEIITPEDNQSLQQHAQGLYLLSFNVDSLSFGKYIEWTLDGVPQPQHNTLQPIEIPFAELISGTHSVNLSVMNADGNPTGLSASHSFIKQP